MVELTNFVLTRWKYQCTFLVTYNELALYETRQAVRMLSTSLTTRTTPYTQLVVVIILRYTQSFLLLELGAFVIFLRSPWLPFAY
jgi:hypothetical protein